jgi:hypothetical protein
MKRHELLGHIKSTDAAYFTKTKDTRYTSILSVERTSTLPRHTEIPNKLASKICKDLGIPEP